MTYWYSQLCGYSMHGSSSSSSSDSGCSLYSHRSACYANVEWSVLSAYYLRLSHNASNQCTCGVTIACLYCCAVVVLYCLLDTSHHFKAYLKPVIK
jgi:hypothetical protein